jgi:serine/threonine protein kinase/Tol biopolymer transport system component
MAIATGTRLGPYEILAAVGAGGMGEVYRARDSRLDRIVAIKVLPAHSAGQDGLRERFEREARAISSLNHPHICVLHDVGHQEGTDYLVMELVEGETLAARLTKGPLPLDKVLRYAIEIADALDKAHRKGINHRDLKPGNIMLAKSGVKLLDFGLAKMNRQTSSIDSLSGTTTAEGPITAQGVILGTLQYMAPEQVEGKEVDARADIFSFGAVVYEMATGKRAFDGQSQASVIAAILERDPPPISSLQPLTPPALDRVVKICLEKDPDDRWQTASDLTRELKWISASGSQAALSAPSITNPAAKPATQWLAWAFGALCLVMAGSIWFSFHRKAPELPQVFRFVVRLPDNVLFTRSAQLVLSPDGRRVAFPAVGSNSRASLWIQDLDAEEAREIPDAISLLTADPVPLFWSADGRYIAISNIDKLLKFDLQSGAVGDICDTPGYAIGGSWNRDGVIIFGTATTGLWRVPAAGGKATPLTVLDASRQEREHELPSFLPDGRHFLYLAVSNVPEQSGVYEGSLDDPPEKQSRKRILATGFGATYTPSADGQPGHLLFMRDGVLMAQSLDLSSLELLGQAAPVAEKVASAFETGHFSATGDVLVFRGHAAPQQYQLTWLDTQGKAVEKVGDPALIVGSPRISPDGNRVAVSEDSSGANEDIWLLDLRRGTNTRFTFGPGTNNVPVWSPDGSEIVFTSNREQTFNLYRKPADGSKAEQLLLRSGDDKRPLAWSHDGRFLLYGTSRNFALEHIWALPMTGEPKPIPFSASDRFYESNARFSPDGRWVTYASNESGQFEIYVRAFSGSASAGESGGKWMISNNGGIYPIWRADGKELAYAGVDGMTLMSVTVDADRSFQAGAPQLLVKLPRARGGSAVAASPDLKRFLAALPVEQRAGESFTVVLNWASALTPK